MRFRGIVPDDAESGESLRIRISDGTEAIVTIPSGVGKGDSFLFELPTDQVKNPKALLKEEQQSTKTTKRRQKDQINHRQQVIIPTATVETKSISDDSMKTISASLVLVDREDDSGKTKNTNKKTFLERDIIDCQDFVLALTVGLLVGTAIVFGFFMGIVYSTETIYALHPIEKPKQTTTQLNQQQHRTNTPNTEPSRTSGDTV